MFICGVPQCADEFSRVLELENSLFGGLALPPAKARDLFEFRPAIYSAVFEPDGSVAAYSTCYPLQQKWADAFIAGDITEPDLTPSILLDPSQSLDGCSIYIGSVVVAARYDSIMKGTLLASLVSWRVQQMLAANATSLSVFMTPVTPQGERMARYAGAKQLSDGSDRKDGHSVYGREIETGFLQLTSSASSAASTAARCR